MTTPAGRRVVLVAAVARNGVIGDGPDIPWRVPGEQREFKELTLGHVLVMGRTTFESIGRPLPGRATVVLTRDAAWRADGVLVAHDVDEAMLLADRAADGLPGQDGEVAVMVAGGAQVYAALFDTADEQVLSLVDLEPDGDVHYPAYDPVDWAEVRREPRAGYDRVWLRRA
ncbi:dihydrofolate reductase [Nocardioides ferulae]|uniref:dihydrofolate reductase n=1 Tax=Nocardioides ferulae TaxID=2340821 RepID=UPI000EB5B53E|nr:dihydrofolate reductase [Nocardioides ferulae]